MSTEELITYLVVFFIIGIIVWYYLRKLKKTSEEVVIKIEKAKEEGLFEPVSLHPEVDLNGCIGSGACITACPEKDILGIINGKATLINASHCVGHGACFHACPVQAISLVIGTEKRGVDLPHVSQNFESNVKGIYIAGELGGMGLIKNSVEQGKQAIDHMVKDLDKNPIEGRKDLVIIGAGPAGISASLQAKSLNLDAIVLEQDTLGGTVATFPRSKIVMTAPMILPLYGKAKLFETKKSELLKIWTTVIDKYNIQVYENCKVDEIETHENYFVIKTAKGDSFESKKILLAIGRRGTPRKLNVIGEDLDKVAYRLLEPEQISNQKIVVVGGGDSAIESALLLCDNNEVILSYRSDKFGRLKPKNNTAILGAMSENRLKVIFNSNLTEINADSVTFSIENQEQKTKFANDRVFIFAGGELPTQFLEKTGIQITKRFGYTVKKHN